MFEVTPERRKHWIKLSDIFTPEHIDIPCPNPACQKDLVNYPAKWTKYNSFAFAKIKCANCGTTTRLFLVDPPTANIPEAINESQLFVIPPPSFHKPLPDGLSKISPAFIDIYTQTQRAELSNLNQLVGIGYRKALEFLVKDYLAYTRPDEAYKIRKTWLLSCITNYVTDPYLLETAKRAIWLGNDHAHYTQKWEDKDIEHLRDLVVLALNWITSDLLKDKLIAEMPDPKAGGA